MSKLTATQLIDKISLISRRIASVTLYEEVTVTIKDVDIETIKAVAQHFDEKVYNPSEMNNHFWMTVKPFENVNVYVQTSSYQAETIFKKTS